MKCFQVLLLIAILSFNVAIAQKIQHNRNQLSLNGIPFMADKKAIVKAFGKPVRQFAPYNECGFLSDDEQGQVFYTLQYKFVSWTGNSKQGYILDNLIVLPNSNCVVNYKGKKLSCQTTQEEFMKLSGIHTFGTNIGKQNPTDLVKTIGSRNLKTTSLDLQDKGSDDKYIFYFLKGKLCKIEYWSPC